MIKNQQEYKLTNGQTVSMQQDLSRNIWEVGCWNADETNHWYKEFNNYNDALKEYEHWKK